MTALRRLRRAAGFAAVAAAAVLSASCGSGTGTVSGKITVNGQPLPEGFITFESEAGNKDAFTAEIKDGLYETRPMSAGPCRVSVVHQRLSRPGGGGNDRVPAPRPKEKAGVTVPDKYGRSDTSGLALTIQPGANTYDKDLTP